MWHNQNTYYDINYTTNYRLWVEQVFFSNTRDHTRINTINIWNKVILKSSQANGLMKLES